MRRAAAILASGLLAGCSMAPAYQRPASPTGASWPTGAAYAPAEERALPTWDHADVFRDPRLQKLIGQALASNRDLRIAAANVARAKAQYRIRKADELPQIDAGAGAVRADNGAGERSDFSADIGITAFEIDLFGRLRSLSDAALNRYFETESTARATRLSLIAAVASAWLDHGADNSLLALAEQTVASARQSTELTRRRLEAGVAPRTDLRQAETILAAAEADLARQRTAIAQDVNALRLLVGEEIDPADLPASIEAALPAFADVPAGLSSDILLRRPDVQAAEFELRAANAEIGAARAALFPRISLTSVAGLASASLSGLFTGGAFTWQAGGGVSYTIFGGGAARAGVAASKASRDAALAAYERSIQSAFREVADALARRGTIGDQRNALERQAKAAADVAFLTNARYRGGVASYLENLDARRSLYAAQRALIATQREQGANLIALYLSLAGDSMPAPADRR
jgi:multidrug efflux system outer membrane protein